MEYFETQTIPETISILDKFGKDAYVLAGGTDLIVDMKFLGVRPKYLVNITKIQDLEYLREETNGLSIGASTKIRTLENHPLLKEKYDVIAAAARHLGTIQVRNRATIGGNICRASPSAEMVPPLLALNAKAVVVGPKGERESSLEDFFTGPGATILEPNELLKELRLPEPPPRTGASYMRLSVRNSLDLAIVNVSSLITLSSTGEVEVSRIAMGAVAPTPMRAKKAESLLVGKKLTEELIGEAGQTASEESRPISDVRGSAEYRKAMVGVLTRRTLRAAQDIAERSVRR